MKILGSSRNEKSFKGFTKKAIPIRLYFQDLGLQLANGQRCSSALPIATVVADVLPVRQCGDPSPSAFTPVALTLLSTPVLCHRVLDGVSGSFPHSALHAIMGPSGCGKSSFLNVLSGRATYGTGTGELFVNSEYTESMGQFRHLVGFVPQDDVVSEHLTVRENLYYSAMLRLPHSAHKEDRDLIVNDTLDLLELRLFEHDLVGSVERRGISGGQLKRVNIGMELVSDPTVLFLDEPTSGLDSTSSAEVINCLRTLTCLGVTVVTIIHQPRFAIFQMFDTVLLLGMGGKTVYCGAAESALEYFSSLGFSIPPNENPADFFLDVITGRIRCSTSSRFMPSQLFELWLEHQTNPKWLWEDAGSSPDLPGSLTQPHDDGSYVDRGVGSGVGVTASAPESEHELKPMIPSSASGNLGALSPQEQDALWDEVRRTPCTLWPARAGVIGLCSPGDMLHGLADFRGLQVSSCFDDRSEFDAVVGSTGACESRPSTSQDTRHFSPRGSGPSDRRPQTMAVVPKKTKSVTVTDEASVIGRPKTLAASPPQGGHRKPRHLRALAKSIVASRCILAKSFEIHRVAFPATIFPLFSLDPCVPCAGG